VPQKLTQPIVEQWIALASGSFNVRDIWHELGVESYEGKQHLRVILNRLEKAGVLAHTSKDGIYRKIDADLKPIDWQSANPEKIVPLKFPFGIEEHCRIYPKSVVVVAGSKNAGKTAFMYNFIAMNMNLFDIDLFNNETGPEQMLERFKPLDIPNPAPFRVYERYDNYSDVIHPDHVSVVDYLDFNSEVYLVGAEIDAIWRKLNNGVAVIGLQKPPGRDLAYGAGFSAKRAVLYITMEASKLKLLYVKTPANPKINPNNMTFNFSIADDGITFTNFRRSYEEGI